jgi:hypothetical protein
MNAKTKSLVRELQTKLVNPLTMKKLYLNEDALLEHAVTSLYEDAKKKRLI